MGGSGNRGLRPAPLPGRHLDDGHGVRRYADRVAVRCPRCDTAGWVVGGPVPRFRCLGCSLALNDTGVYGSAPSDIGDWMGPVLFSGRRPCGYCGHKWVSAGLRRARALPAVQRLAAVCSQCGHRNEVDVHPLQLRENQTIDPYFGLPLRLVEKTPSGLLWAYNAAHLQALHDYATAPLREGVGMYNGSMFSSLPRWMKLARNRELLQRTVQRLQRRLLSGD